MYSLCKEPKRVCYVESNPEWFGYAVMRLFYRHAEWLFVPVQDLSSTERLEEYKKATYFFVSGYGQKEEAIRAHNEGCILVGVRADMAENIPIVECSEWDAFGLYGLIRFGKYIAVLPKTGSFFVRKTVAFLGRFIFIFLFAIKILKTDNPKSIFTKVKKFLKLS